jgi:hypothetical protein
MAREQTKDGLHHDVSRKQQKQITGDSRSFALDLSRVAKIAFQFLVELESEPTKNDCRRSEFNSAVDSERNKQQTVRSYSSADCDCGFDHHPNNRDDLEADGGSHWGISFQDDYFGHA